ncbi:phytoene/squalene synthase family protein [Duffyella gerundensis]|uniref:15-cis-phytoene synthase CrtB n=1 Tax=Duffyella gerundensis TaxID=1619313 RepID=UPI001AE54A87|nr:15-cis-phytoene synthase CrtB [Duffyella gerundensis]QTO54091.1 phytoene/squalene synthase family protein [Duffyella gerundensis]
MNQPLLNHATQTMAAGSKSFATASKLFDASTRRSALMLYAWCRHCDDVIDGQELGFAAPVVSISDAEQRLAKLQSQTRQAYAGAPMDEPAFAAFQEVVLAHDIPQQQAFDHLEGYAMDVRDEAYLNFDDTLRYCYHVAGVVGLMMARVMGVRDEAVLDRACDLGLAFQLTNIARDIVEDAQAGRCYLPADWLAEEGLTPATLADEANRPALARLATRLINAAEPYYDSARAGLPGLPLRCAWAIATARGVYREIGIKVQRAGSDAWQQRQGTSKMEKLGLLISGAGMAVTSRVRSPTPRPAGLWQRPR